MIRRCDDGGSATAEFAVIVPAVVLLIALTAGSLSAVGRLVRLEQAVAQAARLAARGDGLRRRPRAVAPSRAERALLRSRRRAVSMVSADTFDARGGESV